jgi:hypothetical protein
MQFQNYFRTDNYLQAYCECKYNSENIRFIIEIGKFRDAFNADKKCWPKKWKEIDEKLMNEDEDSIDCTWPSAVVSEEFINMIMSDIWDNFIFPDGDTPAFFPSEVVRRTRRRMKLVAHYGPQVFEESTMDHVRNIHREIRPQFLHSPHYQELRRRMKALVRLPTEKDFSIPYPLGTMLAYSEEEDFPDDRIFSLDEILTCRILFEKFLAYLTDSYNSECLLCYRKILTFRARMERGFEATDESWDIYRYFIAPGSTYEVSCNQQTRKKIMLELAEPKASTYDEVLKTVAGSLGMAYSEYSSTPEYAGLSRYMRNKKRESLHEQEVPVTGCFNF